MSATIGTLQPCSRNPFTIFSRLRASFTAGAVIRTISQPTFANSIVCWIDISVSIEKADVSNRANDQNSADTLHHFEHAHVQRFASDRLDQSEQDVPTVQHRNREHVQDREIDVQDYAQPKGQLPAALAHEEQIINSSNPNRP